MEVHPGLEVEKGPEVSDLKKKLKCEPIRNNFSNIRKLSRKLKSIQRAAFRKKVWESARIAGAGHRDRHCHCTGSIL